MIAKLITYGKDRAEAIERMVRAIDEYQITGIQTTLPFCTFALRHEQFVSGKFDTKFVERHFDPEVLKQKDPVYEELAMAFAANLVDQRQNQSAVNQNGPISKWKLRARG